MAVPRKKSRREMREKNAWLNIREASETISMVNIMEDAFVELSNMFRPTEGEERLAVLENLTNVVTTDSVLALSKSLHSRRQLMFALSAMWSENSLRLHVLHIVCWMFEHFERFLRQDQIDLVFYNKRNIFEKIIADCQLNQVVTLAQCLLTSSLLAIHSNLGMFLIGRLIERADSLDHLNSPNWLEDCMPRLATHISCERNADVLRGMLGMQSLKHILANKHFLAIKRQIRKTSLPIQKLK